MSNEPRTWTSSASRALLFAVFALCALSPFLTTGFYQDDSVNSLLRGYFQVHHLTLWGFIGERIHSWMFENGRLYPLVIVLTYCNWYLLHEPFTYRLIQVALVVGNLFLFMKVVRDLGGSRRLTWLCGLIPLSLFQLRGGHDPIASYAFIMQVGMFLGTGSILLFIRYQKAPLSPWALWASLLLYGCALLFYETELAFFPILAFQALRGTHPRHRTARWGHLTITLLYLGAVLFLRLAYPPTYAGTQTQIGWRTLTTLLYQLSAAYPFVYAVFGRSGFYNLHTLSLWDFLSFRTLALGISGTLLFYFTFRTSSDSKEVKDPSELRVLGWTLLLVPAAFVAISAKYQGEINRPGLAYLPVYLSYFGAALLLGRSLQHTRRIKLVSVGFGLILAFTFSANWIAAARLNEFWRDPRTLLEASLKQGILSQLEPDARILRRLRPEAWEWLRPEFFEQNLGHDVPVRDLVGSLRDHPPLPTEKTYLIDTQAQGGAGQGRVVLAQIEQIKWEGDRIKLKQVLTSLPVRVIDFAHGTSVAGWIQKRNLDLLSPELWQLPSTPDHDR